MPENKCEYLGCSLDGLDKNLKELKSDVSKIMEGQEKIIELMVSVKFIGDSFTEFKSICSKEREQIFSRIRDIEQGYVSKRDLVLYSIIVGSLFTFLNFILRFVVK